MRYRSTGRSGPAKSFPEVVIEGAAPDGGLYVPAEDPVYLAPGPAAGHGDFLVATLEAYGAADINQVVADAVAKFHHPEVAPILTVGPFTVMEMFWGPTISFKDHALQILSGLVDQYLGQRGEHRTVLVATSGDTGSASIEAFRGLDTVDIVVVYPDGLVSDFQRRQMTTVPDANVTVVAAQGDFDDCQRLVKDAFAVRELVSANSINWGRIAVQVGYYMSASGRMGRGFDVVIPTGNFGNALSAHLSKELGSLIGTITVATNANRVLADLQGSGEIRDARSVPTLAPAMDIQVPSNLERYLFDHQPSQFGDDFGAGWVGDDRILETIGRVFETHGYILDPHTAIAWAAAEDGGPPDVPRMVVSTAHPAKFAATVEAATGMVPDVPDWAVIDPDLPERVVSIGSTLEELLAVID